MLSDRGTVALAAGVLGRGDGCAAGADGARCCRVRVALAARRHLLAMAAMVLLVGGLAHQGWARVDPVDRGRFEATVTLASDPAPVPGGVRAEVVAGDRRLDARAYGGAAGTLRRRLAGERVTVVGTTSPLPPDTPRSVRARHLAGRLTVTR